MKSQFKVHDIAASKTTPSERGEIRAFIEAVFSDRVNNLFIRNSATHMRIFLRTEGDERASRPSSLRSQGTSLALRM